VSSVLLLVASPCLLVGLLGAAALALAPPVRCGVCGVALPFRDWPARTCAPCLQRWELARHYGAQQPWMDAVGAAHGAGLHGQALRNYVDGALIVEDRRRRAA
jgi:hypothetical protein